MIHGMLVLLSPITFPSGSSLFYGTLGTLPLDQTQTDPKPFVRVGWKLVKRTHFMRADEMDFLSGLEEVEAASYDEPPPKNFVERVWRTIM